AGDDRNCLKWRPKRLKHGLLLTKCLICGEAGAATVILNNNDFFASWSSAAAFKEIAEPHEGQSFAAQIDDAAFVGAVFLRGEFEALLDRTERDYVSFGPHFHGEAINDGEREWKTDGKSGSLAFAAFDLDGATQGIHVSAHDIQADAAAGELRNFVGGRESRLKNQVVNLRLGKARAFGNDSP